MTHKNLLVQLHRNINRNDSTWGLATIWVCSGVLTPVIKLPAIAPNHQECIQVVLRHPIFKLTEASKMLASLAMHATMRRVLQNKTEFIAQQNNEIS